MRTVDSSEGDFMHPAKVIMLPSVVGQSGPRESNCTVISEVVINLDETNLARDRVVAHPTDLVQVPVYCTKTDIIAIKDLFKDESGSTVPIMGRNGQVMEDIKGPTIYAYVDGMFEDFGTNTGRDKVMVRGDAIITARLKDHEKYGQVVYLSMDGFEHTTNRPGESMSVDKPDEGWDQCSIDLAAAARDSLLRLKVVDLTTERDIGPNDVLWGKESVKLSNIDASGRAFRDSSAVSDLSVFRHESWSTLFLIGMNENSMMFEDDGLITLTEPSSHSKREGNYNVSKTKVAVQSGYTVQVLVDGDVNGRIRRVTPYGISNLISTIGTDHYSRYLFRVTKST